MNAVVAYAGIHLRGEIVIHLLFFVTSIMFGIVYYMFYFEFITKQ